MTRSGTIRELVAKPTHLGRYLISRKPLLENVNWISIMPNIKHNMIQNIIRNIKRKNNRGQGLVELALVLPFLLVIVFGVLDLGRVFFTTITLVSAAREGARFLTVNPDDVPDFNRTRVITEDEARNSGIDLNDVDISCTNGEDDDNANCDGGWPAVVTVTTDFDLVLGWLLPSPITISRTAQMVVP